MLTSLRIQNFRCLRDVQLEGFARVNLVGGRNNVGKTALLEALYLLLGRSPDRIASIDSFRALYRWPSNSSGIQDVLWKSLFTGLETERPVFIAGTWKDGSETQLDIHLEKQEHLILGSMGQGFENERILRLNYGGSNPASIRIAVKGNQLEAAGSMGEGASASHYLSSNNRPTMETITELFGQLELAGNTAPLVEALRVLEPDITAVKTIVVGGSPLLFAELSSGRRLPIHLLGDGTVRLGLMLLMIATARNGTVLIDEVENGIHHASLRDVWKTLGTLAISFNTQIFATTHSWDCIREAHAVFHNRPEPGEFRYFRLDRTPMGVKGKAYKNSTLDAALESEIEIR